MPLSESKEGQLGCCISSWHASWRCIITVASDSKASCKDCLSGNASTPHFKLLIRKDYSSFNCFSFLQGWKEKKGGRDLKMQQLALWFYSERELYIYLWDLGAKIAFWILKLLLSGWYSHDGGSCSWHLGNNFSFLMFGGLFRIPWKEGLHSF